MTITGVMMLPVFVAIICSINATYSVVNIYTTL